MNTLLRALVLILALFLIAQCSSSNTATNSNTSTIDPEYVRAVLFMKSILFLPSSDLWDENACRSGSLEINTVYEAGTISFSNCVVSDDLTLTGHYSARIQYDDSTIIQTYDLTVSSSDSSFGSSTMVVDGEINDSDFNLTGTIEDITYSLTGNPTMTGSKISGTLTATWSGKSLACTFNDFDRQTATTNNYLAACDLDIH